MARVSGGDKADRALKDIERRLDGKGAVHVGFLEGATYPATSTKELRADYKARKAKGDASAAPGARGGQSVAMVAAIQNFGAPARGIPPRPFFTNMVRDKAETWGPILGRILRASNYDVDKALALMGEHIAGELREAIVQTNSPPLAEKTAERKGFDKPLVDTGHMLASVDYEVTR